MAQIITRLNGQLLEGDDTNLRQQAAAVGQPTPTTPATAAATGVNPDVAKMAGTPAQTQPVIQEQVAPSQTLQTAQRTEQPKPADHSDANEQATQKAAQLDQLGSLHSRVQAMIENELVLKQGASGQVDETRLAALPPNSRDQARALIQAVIANPQDMQAQANAAQFWQDNNLGAFNPKDFVASAADSLGKQAAEQVADKATIESLPLQANEQEALTSVFGDTWKGMSVPELQQKIEDMRQAEFSRVQGLKAELSTATGAQRQAILEQLAEAGQQGVTGTEAHVKDLNSQIQDADEIEIGGEKHKVEDLLKDDQISDLVRRMLTDKDLAAKVAKTSPEFAKWVSDNATALKDIANDTDAGATQLDNVQDLKHKLADVGNGVTLSDDVMRSIVPDWDKISASVPTIASGLYQTLKDPKLDPATKASMIADIERARSDPEELKKLAAMSADQFKMSHDLAEALSDPLLSKLAGLGQDEGFITDPAKQKEILKYKVITDALNQYRDKAEDGDGYATALDSKELATLIKSGEFTAASAKLLAAHPENLTAYVNYTKQYTQLDAALKKQDVKSALDIMFGSNVDVKLINDEYARAKRMLELDPANKDAKAKLKYFDAMDFNDDGKIDAKDTANIVDMARKDMSAGNKTTGKQDLASILKGGSSNDYRAMDANTGFLHATLKNTPLIDQLEQLLSDKKVTYEELMEADASHPGMGLANAFLKNAGLSKQFKLDGAGYAAAQVKAQEQHAKADIDPILSSFGISPTWGANNEGMPSDIMNLYRQGRGDEVAAAIAKIDAQRAVPDLPRPAINYYSRVLGALIQASDSAKQTLKVEDDTKWNSQLAEVLALPRRHSFARAEKIKEFIAADHAAGRPSRWDDVQDYSNLPGE